MRRSLTIALTLGAACMLLFGCSDTTDPVDSTLLADGDPDKRPPSIYEPPPGFDPFFASLSGYFDTTEWDSVAVTLTIDDDIVFVYPPEYDDPVIVDFDVNPDLVIPANSAPMVFDCTIWLPSKPSSGLLYFPGDAIIFRTQGFPKGVYGKVKIHVPILECFNQTSYTGEFTSYVLDDNSEGFPDASEIETIVLPEWPPADPEITVYVEVPEITDKDGPDGATDRVIQPGDIGGADPGEDE